MWLEYIKKIAEKYSKNIAENKKSAVLNWAGKMGFFPDDDQINELDKTLTVVEIEANLKLLHGVLDGVKIFLSKTAKDQIDKISSGIE